MRVVRSTDVVGDLQAVGAKHRAVQVAEINRSLAPLEGWRTVGDPGEPTLHPDWRVSDLDLVRTPVRFRKDNEGFVFIEGDVRWFRNFPAGHFYQANWGYAFTRIFTLPVGYRPARAAYPPTAWSEQAETRSTFRGGLGQQLWRVQRRNVPGSLVVEPTGSVRPIVVFTDKPRSPGERITIVRAKLVSVVFRAAPFDGITRPG